MADKYKPLYPVEDLIDVQVHYGGYFPEGTDWNHIHYTQYIGGDVVIFQDIDVPLTKEWTLLKFLDAACKGFKLPEGTLVLSLWAIIQSKSFIGMVLDDETLNLCFLKARTRSRGGGYLHFFLGVEHPEVPPPPPCLYLEWHGEWHNPPKMKRFKSKGGHGLRERIATKGLRLLEEQRKGKRIMLTRGAVKRRPNLIIIDSDDESEQTRGDFASGSGSCPQSSGGRMGDASSSTSTDSSSTSTDSSSTDSSDLGSEVRQPDINQNEQDSPCQQTEIDQPDIDFGEGTEIDGMEEDIGGDTEVDKMDQDLGCQTGNNQMEEDLGGQTGNNQLEEDLGGQTRNSQMEEDLGGQTGNDEMEEDLGGQTGNNEMEEDLGGQTGSNVMEEDLGVRTDSNQVEEEDLGVRTDSNQVEDDLGGQTGNDTDWANFDWDQFMSSDADTWRSILRQMVGAEEVIVGGTERGDEDNPTEEEEGCNLDENVDPEEGYQSMDSEDEDAEYDSRFDEYLDFVEGTQNMYMAEEAGAEREAGEQPLVAGMMWPTINEARSFMRSYAISHHFTFKQVKNERKRLKYKCREPSCGWRVTIAQMPDGNTYRVGKKCDFVHTCAADAEDKNPMANSQ